MTRTVLLVALCVAVPEIAYAHNVCVRAQFSYGVSFGSGVVVRREAGQLIVLTAGHVVEEHQSAGSASGDVAVQFEPRGDWSSAIVARSAWTTTTDAAVLLCADRADVSPRYMAASDPRPGELVSIWGGAGAWQERVTSGRVTGSSSDVFTVSAAVRQGDSGGPVVDRRGYVVGVAVGHPANAPHVTDATSITVLRDMVAMIGRPNPELWVFTSETCGPCRQFKAHMAGDTGSIRSWTQQRFDLRWVDVDTVTGRNLMRQHGVTVVPTFMVHDRATNPKLRGYTSPEPYKRALERLLQGSPQAQPEAPLSLPDAPQPTDTQPPAAEPQPVEIPDSRGSPDVAIREAEPPTAAAEPQPTAEESGSSSANTGLVSWFALNALPLILGGGATGGAGLAAWAGLSLARRMIKQKGGGDAAPHAATPRGCPLPKRRLDEAQQLVWLGQLEGRDPLLDATRWTFIEDEIERQPVEHRAAFRDLVAAVNRRAEQVAPLEYKPER